MMSGFVVRYQIKGSNEERLTQVYTSKEEALSQAYDISSYDHIEYAYVDDAPTSNDAFDRYVREKMKNPTFAAEYKRASIEIEQRTEEERHAWDLYAANIMEYMLPRYTTIEQGVEEAAKIADEMLLQRRKRFK